MNTFPDNTSIILFDGVCNFCNYWINEVIRYDKTNRYKFASLQSDAGKKLLSQYNINIVTSDSVVLIENNKVTTKSSAVLKICRRMGGLYPLTYSSIIVPKFIRNWIYDLIARNRYKWFGKAESCVVPTEAMKSKFID